MSLRVYKYIDEMIGRYGRLSTIKPELISAYKIMEKTYDTGGKLLIAGNGGSAADSEHIAGELMKRFEQERPVSKDFADKLTAVDAIRGEKLAKNLERSLMAIPLVAHEALTTAYMNDVDGQGVFAQQLFGYGRSGDTYLGISTSGNSENIISAAIVAKAMDMSVVALTGKDGGVLRKFADISVIVPEEATYKIQELHMPIYHCWCRMLEDRFFGDCEGKQRWD